jgi:hypothetical protein
MTSLVDLEKFLGNILEGGQRQIYIRITENADIVIPAEKNEKDTDSGWEEK